MTQGYGNQEPADATKAQRTPPKKDQAGTHPPPSDGGRDGDERDHPATPGDGATSRTPPGDEVDPGVG